MKQEKNIVKILPIQFIILKGQELFLDNLEREQFYEYKWILKVLDHLMDTWTKGKSELWKLDGHS